ncbi:MtrB/PioB family decaheme-associated outer membrane protein [Shewanella canadensis]|uniref:MtrB/PioB family decaheme-associated outer membrane protein n=1 Tax=Shewanella canadensis TaxID=271096 RepID=A0A3S0J2T6_9GAMM|nr:MtrB/PioB family decaheme-associated outer membrane protein [Shewanella canadensis]RTR36758.1 MtrB/PioB family decaheme-associated outer membrane protein [Shewanella canadensis]
MRYKLNLITLALVSVSGSAMAADFSVNKANTDGVNADKFQCKRCPDTTGYRGSVELGAAYSDSDDIHSANALNSEDGTHGVLNADVQYRGKTGYQAKAQAINLGLANSRAHLEAGKVGSYQAELDYRQLSQYQHDNAKSNLWYADGTLTPSAQVQAQELSLKRKQMGMGLSAGHQWGEQNYQVFARYSQEEKTGYQSASMVTPRPINFGKPFDATTDKLTSGLSISGQNWLTSLNYQYSEYDNQIESLSLPYLADIYAPAPDNSAYQLSLSGQYLFNRTAISTQLATGRMIQDAAVIQTTGNPIQNWDGQVDTTDGKLAITSVLDNRLRLGGSVSYSKRDNKSSVWEFAQLESDGISGAFKQNVLLDTEKLNYKVNVSYRINSDYRLQAGFDREELERSHSAREQTDESTVWTKLDIRSFANSKLKLKASFSQRDGSQYQASGLTSSIENPLLRKFYLADRDRSAFEAKFNHALADWINVSLIGRYAEDDYSDTALGLTSSKDYSYNLNADMQFDKQLSGYAFAGQQWIESKQNGSQSFSTADWSADVDDEFINLGAGMNYTGLMQDKLNLGLDYLFSNSNSDKQVVYTTTQPQGDYYSYNHSVEMYANYLLSDLMAVRLGYRYERYYDTDNAQVDVNAIDGLTTLGKLNHNYNAHQVMLSFSYQLR